MTRPFLFVYLTMLVLGGWLASNVRPHYVQGTINTPILLPSPLPSKHSNVTKIVCKNTNTWNWFTTHEQ